MEKKGMIDNRKVSESKGGIKSKMQKPGEAGRVGQSGKMGKGDKANWSRSGSLTPRRA